MILFTEAQNIALSYINSNISPEYEISIVDESTLEFEHGWVFFYQSKEYIKTGNFLHMLGGNAPLIVDKNNGEVTETGTAYDIAHYINEYNK